MRFDVQTAPLLNEDTQIGWKVSVSGTVYKYAQVTEYEAVLRSVEEFLSENGR